jgi:tRNA threonylcarbamoyladenosine biosynthesis protein TsaE
MPALRTHTEEETIAVGRLVARQLPPRAVVLLCGNLGAGKTTIAKGIVEGLGAAASDEVSSPTFTLVHEYGGGRVFHIDLYRIEDARELRTLGLEELLERDAVLLVEWGERFPELWPRDRIEIHLRTLDGEEREILVSEG